MIYERLGDFVQNRMRTSYVQQPVMLLALLWGGRSSIEEIARSIHAHDESRVEYYEEVTKNMVGRVLRRHGIVEKDKVGYSISGYDDLHAEQVEGLIDLCESKLEEYEKRRGGRIWQHRRASAGYAPRTLRYEVLKRARFRCELCGVPAEARALEQVDHILPHARGGTDEPDNLQALCFSCNAAKRDRDATDFRGVRKAYDRREPRRPFCEIPYGLMMSETDLAYAVRDGERAHVAYRFSEPAFHDLFLAPADVFALRSVLGLDKVAEGIASDLEIETLSITSRLKGQGSL